ncbi:MAG: type IV pilus assembly protein PilM [Candidatus Harrisonbacteria bacterium]|nr:type IV pilus assembly protein PilM [Candidatus Harrisonbacteria bacterium]MBI2406448.1 type IV pilus assembly protein PilM [Candidatus Harrisonbacteria bacterium]
MFQFIKNIFGDRTYLGVDIGTTSLKIAEVRRGKNGAELLNYGYLESFDYLERANQAFQTSTLKLNEGGIAKFIRALMKQSGIPAHPVIASLPSFSSFSTLIEVPQLSERELAESMQLQAKQYVPMPISEVKLDWQKVGERRDEKGALLQQILLISVPNEVVARYQKIFSLAGLSLLALEVEGLSLARSATMGTAGPALVMDIGARSTTIVVAENGFMKFAGQTDFAGATLTQTVATGLKLGNRRAEEMKRHRGLTGAAGEYELFTLLQPMVDVIINEGMRVRKNYETLYKTAVTRIILAGGGANLPGLHRYIAKETGLPVSHAAPFERVAYPISMAPLLTGLGPIFAVAIGLGLKEL